MPGGNTEVGLKGDVPGSGHSPLPDLQDITRNYSEGGASTTSKQEHLRVLQIIYMNTFWLLLPFLYTQ